MARESGLRSWARVKSGRLWPACCVCFPACLPACLIARLLAYFPAACMPACERACLPALPTYLPALPTYLRIITSKPCLFKSHEFPSEEKLRKKLPMFSSEEISRIALRRKA